MRLPLPRAARCALDLPRRIARLQDKCAAVMHLSARPRLVVIGHDDCRQDMVSRADGYHVFVKDIVPEIGSGRSTTDEPPIQEQGVPGIRRDIDQQTLLSLDGKVAAKTADCIGRAPGICGPDPAGFVKGFAHEITVAVR